MALRLSASLLTSGLRRQMATQSRAMSQMAFTFAAPNAVHYNAASVKQVDVPSFSGSFGILPAHVASGSITINDDSSVQILAEEAHAVEDLDAAAAKAALAEAQAAVAAAGADEVAKAEAMIAVEVSEALVAAAQ